MSEKRSLNKSHVSTAHRVAFETVFKKLKERHFAVLSTVTPNGRSHSVGVVYGISPHGQPLEIYVMTRTHLKKARNIMANPNVSLVVPLTRLLLTFPPPPCIQFQGKAEIIDWKDKVAAQAFKTFFMGRRILNMYEDFFKRGERRTCFLRITPDPVVFTYMVGYSILEMRRRMESGMEKVEIPKEYRKPQTEASRVEA